jgi:hypothetical protein
MEFKSLSNYIFSEALKATQGPFWFAEKFCHYTNLHGMVGIIESQEIWLSDHRFLNDAQEISYGRKLAIERISAISESEPNKEFALFLRSIIERIKQPRKQASYICSMSLAIDVLDQWKWYGGSTDGICLVFNGSQNLWNKGNDHPTHVRQRKIAYKEREQLSLIEALIDFYKSRFKDFKNFQHPFIEELAWLIEDQFIGFKDQQYESEREIRLTIENLDHIIKEREVKHRIAKGFVIPYITTSYISKTSIFRPGQIPIVEIILSPLAKPETVSSIEVYLNNMGLDSINVRLSNVKFRG